MTATRATATWRAGSQVSAHAAHAGGAAMGPPHHPAISDGASCEPERTDEPRPRADLRNEQLCTGIPARDPAGAPALCPDGVAEAVQQVGDAYDDFIDC